MTSGGSGITSGDDYVAARLSIDIPAGSAEGVREITREVEQFRVAVEAATHVEADMSRYLEQMTGAAKAADQAHKELVNTLQGYMALTARMAGAPVVPSSGVPLGAFQQPFGSAGAPGLAAGPRPPNPSDVAYQLGMTQANNPREWLNMQHARGGVTAQDVVNISPQSIQDLANKIADREQTVQVQAQHTKESTEAPSAAPGRAVGDVQQRVKRGASLAGQVMNELTPGAAGSGLAGMAVQGLQYLARRSGQAGGRPPSTAKAPATTEPTESAPGEPGMGSEPVEGAPPPEDPGSPASGPQSSGGLGGISKLLGPIAGVAGAALSVFGLIQKGGGMVQGARNVASVRGGAAGQGMEVEAKARIMAMNPFISQDQARQIYQSVMSEGYADASGAGADNVIDFMKHNLTSMNISVAESTKMLRSTIVGTGEGDKNSVAGSVAMLSQELDTIRSLSKGSALSTPDFRKGVMNLQEALTAAGASSGGAATEALAAEEVGSGDQILKGQFAKAEGDLSADESGGALLENLGGVNVPGNLLPGAVAGFLADHGELNQATQGVLTQFAQQASMLEDGTEVGHRNAVLTFYHQARSRFPSTDAAKSQKAAEAFYNSVRKGSGFSDAAQKLSKDSSSLRSDGTGAPVSFSPADTLSMSPSSSGSSGSSDGGSSGSYMPPPVSSSHVSGQANVQIGLTPEAQRLLSLMGNNKVSVPLSPTSKAANAGLGDAQVNNQAVG